jgi:hypothetical protein
VSYFNSSANPDKEIQKKADKYFKIKDIFMDDKNPSYSQSNQQIHLGQSKIDYCLFSKFTSR